MESKRGISELERAEPKHQSTADADAAKRLKLDSEYYDEADIDSIIQVVLNNNNANNAVRATDVCGRLPHHLLLSVLMDDDDDSYIKALGKCCKEYPQGFKVPDIKGFIPLDHFTFAMIAQDHDGITCMVEDLLDDVGHNPASILNVGREALVANPDAIFSSGLFHVVADEYSTTEEDDEDSKKISQDRQKQVVKTLMELVFGDYLGANATTVIDNDTGDLPMHIVARHLWRKHMNLILPVDPNLVSADALKVGNLKGQLPLHLAVSGCGSTFDGNGYYHNYGKQEQDQLIYHTVSEKLIQQLVDSFPGALTAKDNEGLTPLEVARQNKHLDQAILKYLTPNK